MTADFSLRNSMLTVHHRRDGLSVIKKQYFTNASQKRGRSREPSAWTAVYQAQEPLATEIWLKLV